MRQIFTSLKRASTCNVPADKLAPPKTPTPGKSMTYLIAGLILFFGIHSIAIVAPQARDRMAKQLGELPWKALYSLIAIAGFVLIAWGYGIARQNPTMLYDTPHWMRHVTALLMLPVFPLLLAAYLPGRIKNAMKHPMLVATKTWALAHLLVNGGLHDVLLFGTFLTWAVLDRISLKRRPARPIPSAPTTRFNDISAIVLGAILYVAFVKWLHVEWIGVVPLP
jgi:uncharacterized membrane protein